jgi:RecB family exonuclease
MKPFRELPASIQRIDVPQLFSPTSLGRAFQCRLAGVLAGSGHPQERLPPDPRALLGTVFHRLVELSAMGRLDPAPDRSSAVRNTLDRLLAEKDRALEASDLRHYVPLAKTVTYPEFLDRRARALANASRHFAELPPVSGTTRAPKGTGAERQMVSEELRLTARMDLVERDGEAIVVRDFKTGNVRDADGSIAGHIRLQMWLYGLLAMKAFPGMHVRLVIEHNQAEDLPFSASEKTQAEGQRERLLDGLRPGQTDAAGLAAVGEHCRWCDSRHVCLTYRSEAPNLWSTPRIDHPLPLDIWGTLTEKPQRMGAGDHAVHMRDDAGRRAAIVRLHDRHGPLDALVAGDRLWFFGLEPRGDLRNVGGEYSHPVNFRELPTGAGERRAYRLQVFRENGASPTASAR